MERLTQDRLGDVAILSSLWDIVRLHRLSASGRQRETISVDLLKRFGEPLPCLQADSAEEGYRAFLMLIPGQVLRRIYSDFGSRLLETNVRSFLQARGKVNSWNPGHDREGAGAVSRVQQRDHAHRRGRGAV